MNDAVSGEMKKIYGDVSEWLKEHAWKVCIPLKGIEGSNPSPSAVEGLPLAWHLVPKTSTRATAQGFDSLTLRQFSVARCALSRRRASR